MEFTSVSCIALKGVWCDIFVVNLHVASEDIDGDIKDSLYEELERLFGQLTAYYMKILFAILLQNYGKRMSSSQQ